MSLPERVLVPEVAEAWIRDCLRIDPGGVAVTVSGTCMEPALMAGSRIRLKAPSGAVRVGDVVLLNTAAGLRLHRILLHFRDAIRTKGDRGHYLDPLSSKTAVIAVWDTTESWPTRFGNAARSLIRLLGRPFRMRGAESDEPHVAFLP